MARIKLAYIGGGSTRAAGTMASFVWQGANFDGSEVVLIDLDEERLGVVQTIAQKMAHNRFGIAGGKPGMEISWQITGVRNDAYAQAHPMMVEQPK